MRLSMILWFLATISFPFIETTHSAVSKKLLLETMELSPNMFCITYHNSAIRRTVR